MSREPGGGGGYAEPVRHPGSRHFPTRGRLRNRTRQGQNKSGRDKTRQGERINKDGNGFRGKY